MSELLLHCCCAPCSAAVVEWLMANGWRPTLFFYNPNIHPREEYERRKAELVRLAAAPGLTIIDGDWDHDSWLAAVRGHELDPERGPRCQLCFDLRLRRAAALCRERGLPVFATTLASSRWKDLAQVDAAGESAAAACPPVRYWARNWRRGGLQERRAELIRSYRFYNQTWCGCEFSRAAAEARRRPAPVVDAPLPAPGE